MQEPLPGPVSTGTPYGRRLTKMQDEQLSTEDLWLLVRHYERLIQLLLEQLEKADG